jgi:hypothetical protein
MCRETLTEVFEFIRSYCVPDNCVFLILNLSNNRHDSRVFQCIRVTVTDEMCLTSDSDIGVLH